MKYLYIMLHTYTTVYYSIKAYIYIYSIVFFFCEGPRSRRYGRTAAMRLLVQPCDEDDDDDYYFLSFPSNAASVE
jgi:hypothetical protein